MSKTRDNHYVPQWHQKGFISGSSNQLHYLDLNPDKEKLPDGRIITMNSHRLWPTSKCFFEKDLYTTFFGEDVNDEIERELFGKIDDMGSRAVRAFITEGPSEWHTHFTNLFTYIDAQKIRTPKGLNWIRSHYPNLDQVELMREMQAIRQMHCTIWSEGVREIVSAENSEIKFILSDHPVTIYNHACLPENRSCTYPNEPTIAFKGTQTIFPLDMNNCLILTNYEYARNPETENPIEKRTNARNFRNTLVRTDAFIRTRSLNSEEVLKINHIIKSRARRYIAAHEKSWLYPEEHIRTNWSSLRYVLLPPKSELFRYGGEMYVGYKDGGTYYQDAFGRTTPDNNFLKKQKRKGKIYPNELCVCGSGKKFKKCCRDVPIIERPACDVLSIRERNLVFINGIVDILGLTKEKTWDDVRRELSNDQVKSIHDLYGFLWPLDTDISSLLPKPDNTLRTLYTGIIDPRVIFKSAVGLSLYFDETIIQNPFINPLSAKNEFSPTSSPQQYKLQTLKNVILLLSLAPFIDAGHINLIPDPCTFDSHLQKQMFSMAEKRSKNFQIPKQDYKVMDRLCRDDLERTLCMLSKSQQEIQIRQALPKLTDKEVSETLRHIEAKALEDPFTLLQSDVYNTETGQLQILNMSPNFELSLYLAQITGSILLTDSAYRWQEISNSKHDIDEINNKDLIIFNDCLSGLKHSLITNPELTFYLRQAGRLGEIRKALRNIYTYVKNKVEKSANTVLPEELLNQYIRAYNISQKELAIPKDIDGNIIKNADRFRLDFNFNSILPSGGIVHNNVQRMILSSGIHSSLKNVPMAIFSEHT